MKKIILITLICALTISLCACTKTSGPVTKLSGQFIVVKKVVNDDFLAEACYYIYDNDTKIVYLYTKYEKRAIMCPYYVIENGKPALAIYGVNYP